MGSRLNGTPSRRRASRHPETEFHGDSASGAACRARYEGYFALYHFSTLTFFHCRKSRGSLTGRGVLVSKTVGPLAACSRHERLPSFPSHRYL